VTVGGVSQESHGAVRHAFFDRALPALDVSGEAWREYLSILEAETSPEASPEASVFASFLQRDQTIRLAVYYVEPVAAP